jgi:hypothetical protein
VNRLDQETVKRRGPTRAVEPFKKKKKKKFYMLSISTEVPHHTIFIIPLTFSDIGKYKAVPVLN